MSITFSSLPYLLDFHKQIKSMALPVVYLKEPLCLFLKAYFTWEGVFHRHISAAIYVGSRNSECG